MEYARHLYTPQLPCVKYKKLGESFALSTVSHCSELWVNSASYSASIPNKILTYNSSQCALKHYWKHIFSKRQAQKQPFHEQQTRLFLVYTCSGVKLWGQASKKTKRKKRSIQHVMVKSRISTCHGQKPHFNMSGSTTAGQTHATASLKVVTKYLQFLPSCMTMLTSHVPKLNIGFHMLDIFNQKL